MQSLKIGSIQKTQEALSLVTEQLYDELRQSTLKHWLDDHKVAKNLDEKVNSWAFQAKSNLDQQHPYMSSQKQFEYWMSVEQINPEQFKLLLEDYQAFNESIGSPDFSEFWQFQNQVQTSSLMLQFQLLKEKWQRKLTEAIAHWEFEQLALQRDAFLEEIKDFLATLQKMSKHKDSLGMDTGIFVDYSKGKLTPKDVQQFTEWTEYLEKDAELLKLCKMIGSAQPSERRRKAKAVNPRIEPENQFQRDHLQEEIVGIHLAQDLNLALPSELALLADPDLQILFDLKYLESNIMGFHMQGQQSGRVIEDPQHQKQQLGQKGPMVVCLDTSGSMHGQPELISKAICLFLAMQAMKEKRAMYIINFSTNLTALDLQKEYSLDDLIHFLSQSFHGGTDIIPAITHAVDMLEQPHFQNADVVVISDFIMGNLNEELMERIGSFKQQGNGFYAVAIGNFRFDHLNNGLFDQQWIYQANSGKVIKL